MSLRASALKWRGNGPDVLRTPENGDQVYIREALIHSARAGGEGVFSSRRFRKRWNPVWISRFLNRADGGKIRRPAADE